ncbi:Rieske (2Fe-2S) protein [Actinosynnema sp. NPDC047251]|uniref:Rieske domain-containing protein n=1 Tax=Saccharothrix espanaensis (strain ATCC 51144 / DSM 44229 / JCM 9112 / NBRC 15066 / NRRL 15764) TaxID=1179773 RepID=K0K9P5_SACES|nr:Rieske (2Fe-2S) protein [Saccharothrix espanaensis]CCH33529.1 hypothetical protein BN6_62820 [Saccharothrix espanaensis DSM 44229]
MERRTLLLCGLLALTGCGAAGTARKPGVGSAKTGDRVAGLADVPAGTGKLVDMPGDGQLLVVRTDAGVRVFNPACPHQGTVVNPPAAGVITCPTHRSEFDLSSGAVLSGPSPKGLVEVPVRVAGEDVLLA